MVRVIGREQPSGGWATVHAPRPRPAAPPRREPQSAAGATEAWSGAEAMARWARRPSVRTISMISRRKVALREALGLAMQSAAPRSRQRTNTSASLDATADETMTLAAGHFRRSCGRAAAPSRSGISTSSTTTSGFTRSIDATASAPLRRTATTHAAAADSHRDRRLRTTTASSTIITRMGRGAGSGAAASVADADMTWCVFGVSRDRFP